MIGRTRSLVLTGLAGHVVEVEAHVANGLPAFTIVGLPDASLSESRDRVRAAFGSSGLTWPSRRVTVNLSPASLPKSGAGTDLAIAVAVLSAAGEISHPDMSDAVHLGELGLDGRVRPVRGILPAVVAAVEAGWRRVVVPGECVAEAALVPGVEVMGVDSLGTLARRYGNADAVSPPAQPSSPPHPAPASSVVPDLRDVRGQEEARMALEIAAAGGHHLLMVGPPGAGKTMLASRLPGLLPPLTDTQALQATAIHSLSGSFDPGEGLLRQPPLEAPHHSASAAAIVGGGTGLARPGAISRAHGGVLFLDEAPEFAARVLQTLRQPLEHGEVVLHRSFGAVRFPAQFQLVLAANPCPCGKFYGPQSHCVCRPLERRRYFGRLSGPLLDRVDLQVELLPVRSDLGAVGESTAAVAERVRRARERTASRLAGTPWSRNCDVSGRWLRENTPRTSVKDVNAALDRGLITARGADRALRVAWTLADLAAQDLPSNADVARAMTLRTRSAA